LAPDNMIAAINREAAPAAPKTLQSLPGSDDTVQEAPLRAGTDGEAVAQPEEPPQASGGTSEISTREAAAKRKPRKNDKVPLIKAAISKLKNSKDWPSLDTGTCLKRIEAQLDKPKGWCTQRSYFRALAKMEGDAAATSVT